MKKTTLVIMAAGIGSRYKNGIKQLETVGPNGEVLMDYAIYDALAVGFNKFVFVIRRDMEDYFRKIIGDRIKQRAEVVYVYQSVCDLPVGFSAGQRVKPWGTGQAVLACKNSIKEPFVVLNADDYYGKKTIEAMYHFLSENHSADRPFCLGMAGFRLGNTLSNNGGVTRGICTLNEMGYVTSVHETRNIEKIKGKPAVRTENKIHFLNPNDYCSMNIWGLTPDFFPFLENKFISFLERLPKDDVTSEYLLPDIIDDMLKAGKAKLMLMPTDEKWFGMTYQEDKAVVRESIRKLIKQGAYPENIM